MSQSHQQAGRSKFRRFLRWSLLGFLTLVIIVVLGIHLPFVQNIIASKATSYLSKKTGGEFSLGKLRFSVLGTVSLDSLTVLQPDGQLLAALEHFEVHSNLLKLLRSDIVLNDLVFSGADINIIQSGDGMNFDFITQAFQSGDTSQASDPSTIKLRSNSVILENIAFVFQADSMKTSVTTGQLLLANATLSVAPNMVEIDSVILSGIDASVMAPATTPDTSMADTVLNLPPLDLGSGFTVAVGHFRVDNTNINYRDGSPPDTTKFDTGNMTISSVRLRADALRMGEEELGLELNEFKSDLNALPVDSVSFHAVISQRNASMDELYIGVGNSTLTASLELQYNDWVTLPSQLDDASGTVDFEGELSKPDLDYLLPDSVREMITSWSDIIVSSSVEHKRTTTSFKSLNLKTGSSSVVSSGQFENLMFPEDINWSNTNVSTSIGPEFKGTIRSFSNQVRIPPDLRVDIRSDGNRRDFTLHSDIISTWGDITSSGNFGYQDGLFDFNTSIAGRSIALDSLLNLEWADSCEVDVAIVGQASSELKLAVDGRIVKIGVMNQTINDIYLNGRVSPDSAFALIDVRDARFPATLDAGVGLGDTMDIIAGLFLDSFAIGRLVGRDSSLYGSGNFNLVMDYSASMFGGSLITRDLKLSNSTYDYTSDSLDIKFYSAPDTGSLFLQGDDLYASLISNFDLRQFPVVVDSSITKDMYIDPDLNESGYAFTAQMEVLTSAPFELFDLKTEKFTSLRLDSRLDAAENNFVLDLTAGAFESNKISLDTMKLTFKTDPSDMALSTIVSDIVYDSMAVGSFFWDASREREFIYNNIRLIKDSTEAFGIHAHVEPKRPDILIYADSIIILNRPIDVSANSPIIVRDSNVHFDNFLISEQGTEISMNGDLDQFMLGIANLPLRELDSIFTGKGNIINRGTLQADLTMDGRQKSFNGSVLIDSIQFYDAPPLMINVDVHSEEDRMPFEVSVRNDSNTISAQGDYTWSGNSVNAEARMDIHQLQSFDFLTKSLLDKMDGSLSADITVSGPVSGPVVRGQMRFEDVDIVVSHPHSGFQIQDEIIEFTDKGIVLNSFSLLDKNGTPLVLNGQLETEDYTDFNYDLNIKTDDYVLIDNPRKPGYEIQGLLAAGADIDVSGNKRDLTLKANINISDSTDLVYVIPQRNVELITGAGIVDFVDPNEPQDSLIALRGLSYYDSIIASLPTLNLNSTLRVRDESKFRVVVDQRSGDYIEARGSANVALSMDRTGNIQMTGNYEITEGRYQLSFYDLVQKRFDIAAGSRIQWGGAPDQGTIDITAKHTVRTSSIGLIGDEISENETYLYRRPLPYTVSIIITGTIEEPEVAFSLDLPQSDRLNYPVLDSKLSRLAQPEFESQRNKQVFGLLALGGFIPESADDFDEMAVATTAIANSVNSLLAAQLNRLTNKVQAVDINIGLQSYNDFQSGSGMRTAVDLRISKRLLNDRMSIEVGGELDVGSGKSSAYQGTDNFRSDITVIYDLTESGNTRLKAFNNETYDIIYHEIRNTGVALIFIREFDKGEGVLPKKKAK